MMPDSASNFTAWSLAFALILPAIIAAAPGEADAHPGRLIGESRQGGERQHRQQNREQRSQDDDDDSDRNRRRSRDSSSNRDGIAQGDARPTGRVRPASEPAPTTPSPDPNVTRTTTTTRTTTHVRRRSRHVPFIGRSSTSVHHHHYHEPTLRYEEPNDGPEPYFLFGVGLGAFASAQIVDEALPGTHFNLGLGARGRLLAFELGFDGGLYRFDPQATGIDLSVMGMTGDLFFKPSITFFEPYGFVGLGGYLFQDGIMREAAVGAALRMGFGIDFRIDALAIGARYLYGVHGYANDYGLYQRLGARTEAVTVNASLYF
jgi:hypothetical protein